MHLLREVWLHPIFVLIWASFVFKYKITFSLLFFYWSNLFQLYRIPLVSKRVLTTDCKLFVLMLILFFFSLTLVFWNCQKTVNSEPGLIKAELCEVLITVNLFLYYLKILLIGYLQEKQFYDLVISRKLVI